MGLTDSASPIQPLLLGDERAALAMSAELHAAGIWIPAIRPPAVPHGTSRLRVTFSAVHEADEVDRLLETLARLVLDGRTR